jgi:hypothetical protein
VQVIALEAAEEAVFHAQDELRCACIYTDVCVCVCVCVCLCVTVCDEIVATFMRTSPKP